MKIFLKKSSSRENQIIRNSSPSKAKNHDEILRIESGLRREPPLYLGGDALTEGCFRGCLNVGQQVSYYVNGNNRYAIYGLSNSKYVNCYFIKQLISIKKPNNN